MVDIGTGAEPEPSERNHEEELFLPQIAKTALKESILQKKSSVTLFSTKKYGCLLVLLVYLIWIYSLKNESESCEIQTLKPPVKNVQRLIKQEFEDYIPRNYNWTTRVDISEFACNINVTNTISQWTCNSSLLLTYREPFKVVPHKGLTLYHNPSVRFIPEMKKYILFFRIDRVHYNRNHPSRGHCGLHIRINPPIKPAEEYFMGFTLIDDPWTPQPWDLDLYNITSELVFKQSPNMDCRVFLLFNKIYLNCRSIGSIVWWPLGLHPEPHFGTRTTTKIRDTPIANLSQNNMVNLQFFEINRTAYMIIYLQPHRICKFNIHHGSCIDDFWETYLDKDWINSLHPHTTSNGWTRGMFHGSACCVFLESDGLFLGIGHYTHHDKQDRVRAYSYFFYVFDSHWPFRIRGISTLFCFTYGDIPNGTRPIHAYFGFEEDDDYLCSTTDFVSSISRNGNFIWLTMGELDCYGRIIAIPLNQIQNTIIFHSD